MRTVQEAFINADKKELVESYMREYPVGIDDFDDGTTIGEARSITKKGLGAYIDHLRTIAIKKSVDEKDWIFYAYHYLHDGITAPGFALSTLEDLRQKGSKALTFNYELTEQAEVMGYHIADNKLTEYYLTELLTDIMHETSFFGFKQEHLQDEIDKLRQSEKDIDEGKTLTREDFLRELGWDDLDEFSPEEESYRQKINDYEQKIITRSKMIEIGQILQSQNHN